MSQPIYLEFFEGVEPVDQPGFFSQTLNMAPIAPEKADKK